MSEVRVVLMEYGQVIYQCPTEDEGYMCDLEEPCPECPLLSRDKHKERIND